ADAFSLLDQIVAARTKHSLATVIDTLGLDPERRRGYLDQARRSGLPAVAVLFDTDPGLCRERNRARAVAVPARLEPAHTPARAASAGQPEPQAQPEARPELSFYLHVSSFQWGEDP